MNLETAQQMVRFAFASVCDHFGLDQTIQLQDFLSGIDDDYLLTELEDFVAAKLDTKMESWIKAAKKIKEEGVKESNE
jgi:hypothetical protein